MCIMQFLGNWKWGSKFRFEYAICVMNQHYSTAPTRRNNNCKLHFITIRLACKTTNKYKLAKHTKAWQDKDPVQLDDILHFYLYIIR